MLDDLMNGAMFIGFGWQILFLFSSIVTIVLLVILVILWLDNA